MKTIKNSTIILVAATLVGVSIARGVDIVGVTIFKGTPPPEKEITILMDNADCAAAYKTPPKTQFYVVGSKGELADVVVSLKDVTGKSTGASAAPAVVDQKGCLYTPTIVAIQTGQKLVVKNSDNCIHNGPSKPTADAKKESNDV